MTKVPAPDCDLHEQVHIINDAATGARGMIAIHSTSLGPAAGGCRLWHYDSVQSLEVDALRLARAMSYKNALAGLPFGGGQAVLQRPLRDFDRRSLLRVFGEAVESLGGQYVTAPDVGTSLDDMNAVRTVTKYVAGLNALPGKAGGDPAPWTALGVFEAMTLAARFALGCDLEGLIVAVQGTGGVGSNLCRRLAAAGAKLVIADMDSRRTEVLALNLGARVVSIDEIAKVDCDIFSPCALGGTLNQQTIHSLKAHLVCGAANNQLANPTDGDALLARGITYAPDYLINAGGIINLAAEYRGETTRQAKDRVKRIATRLETVLIQAATEGTSPAAVADQMARQIIRETHRAAA